VQIRAEQIDSFSESVSKSFENRMVLHLNKHFPEHCKALGEPGVREAIDTGIQKAKNYRIVSERDVCKFITLMFAFGRDFDTDPKLPWASNILRTRVYNNPTDRINALYETAKTRSYQASLRQV
jgi:hypothetical protein